MSEAYKLKYEVLKLVRQNILQGLESFGLPISETKDDGGWRCIESDQPSYRNLDKVVTVYLAHTERIGLQGGRAIYNEETDKFDVCDSFIEQQEWTIRVLYKSTTGEITDEVMNSENPVYSINDIASMLVAWFNRLGCAEFRKHNCGNLPIKMKDIETYKDDSDVSQWIVKFPLKLHVPKMFVTEIDKASPMMEGMQSF